MLLKRMQEAGGLADAGREAGGFGSLPVYGRFLQVDPVGYEDQASLYPYVGNDPVNARDPRGEATIYWNGDKAAHVVFYLRMVENGAEFKFDPQELNDYVSQSVQGNTMHDGVEVSVTSEVVFVADDDRITGGEDVKNMYQNSSENHPKGFSSYTSGLGGDVHLQENESLPVAAHEVPHTGGAGDQRPGGVDAAGNRIPLTARGFEPNLMNNGARRANAQTLSEILKFKGNVHVRKAP